MGELTSCFNSNAKYSFSCCNVSFIDMFENKGVNQKIIKILLTLKIQELGKEPPTSTSVQVSLNEKYKGK